ATDLRWRRSELQRNGSCVVEHHRAHPRVKHVEEARLMIHTVKAEPERPDIVTGLGRRDCGTGALSAVLRHYLGVLRIRHDGRKRWLPHKEALHQLRVL